VELPVVHVLPDLAEALALRSMAVLQAPPGAGKMTVAGIDQIGAFGRVHAVFVPDRAGLGEREARGHDTHLAHRCSRRAVTSFNPAHILQIVNGADCRRPARSFQGVASSRLISQESKPNALSLFTPINTVNLQPST
jgi:hypothetical protein